MAWDKTQNLIAFAFSKESWRSGKGIHNLSDWINLKMSQLNQYVDEFREQCYADGHPDELEEETEKLRKSLLHFRTVEWWINCEIIREGEEDRGL